MFRAKAVIVACVFGLLAGCGAHKVQQQQGTPISGAKVLVQQFDLAGVKVDSYEGSTAGFGLEFAQALSKKLQEAGLQAEAVPDGAAIPPGAYVVKGQVIHIDGGSRAARYWAGFGAGATEFAVKGQVLGKSSETVGTFVDARRSGFGMFGGDSEALMHRCVESVAEDVAQMITTGNYKDTYSK